jgi:exodeoxyribonuclease-3
VRLLSYNIRHGGVGREDALGAVIRAAAPDAVVLQEATVPAVVERLAQQTGLSHWAARARHSVAVMSRWPIRSHGWQRPWWSRRAFLTVTLAGSPWTLVGVHLTAVHATWTERRRVVELRSVLRRQVHRGDARHIVVGDFNTLAPGEALDLRRLPPRLRALVWLSGGRIRWATIQLMLEAGYMDAFRLLHSTDAGCTFPTWEPHVRLDYAFVPGALASHLTACRVVREVPRAASASDHFPLLVELEGGQSGT